MRLKKGVMFRAVDKEGGETFWKIKDIRNTVGIDYNRSNNRTDTEMVTEVLYSLIPILETLEKCKTKLRKAKEENPFLNELQTLTAEEYSKIIVNKEWFLDRDIYSLGENSIYLIFDKGQWEESKLICVCDEDSLDDCLWEVQKDRSYTDDEMDKNIFVKEQKINAWVNPAGIYSL